VPLAVLAAADAAITLSTQKAAGALHSMPLGLRIGNALVSHVAYLLKAFWPDHLAFFYPYPDAIPGWEIAGSTSILLAITAFVYATRRAHPYLGVGWCWYLVALVPVAGYIQPGWQSRADRYTYVPLVAITVMLAWGGVDLIRRWPRTKPFIAAVAAALVLASSAIAWRQTSYWRDSETLYTHAIEVTHDNWLAHGLLASALAMKPERRGETVAHLEIALRIRPDYAQAHNTLAVFLSMAGLYDRAIPHFEAALREAPDDVPTLTNMGLCLLSAGRYAQAAAAFDKALRIDPNALAARLNRGMALSNIQGRETEAIADLETALRSRPDEGGATRLAQLRSGRK